MPFNFFLLLLGSLVLLSSPAAVQALDTGVEHDKTLVSVRHSNEHEIKPGSFDGDIARTTGLVLQQQHYSQKGFNTEISSRFLDRYLDLLDPMHIYFLQSDVESFDMFRNSLDKITLRRAEATPGFAIFNRFMDRLEQQYEHVMTLLKQPDWDFTGDDRYVVNRKDLPRPKDMAQAKEQWKARVRYEYLQEKLNAIEPDEISKIVREKVESGQLKELEAALKNKLGKERIDQIVKGIAGKSAEEASLFTRNHVKKSTHEDIVKTISRRYSRIVRMFREFDNDDVMGFYLTALARVYDPHSDYMDRGQLDNFSIGMNLSLFGIGAVLRSEDGYCKIAELMAAGPASKSGLLKPNDKIVAVAQAEGEWVDVVDMKLQKVVEMIRGPKGTKVRLRFNPADAADSSVRKEIELVRDEIKLEDQEAKARIIESPDAEGRIHKVGVIDLPSFYASFAVGSVNREGSEGKSTTTDVAKLLKRLVKEGVTGVVLDLRKNGGGSLEEAINLTGLFIKQGPVVQIRNSDDTVDVDEDKDPRVQYDGPLVVLTSRFSASASEILAGALQDYGRAVVVGESTTHGKGTVQSVMQLGRLLRTTNNLGAVKLTIRKFYRASGDSTQLKGVIPDIVLPSVNNVAEIGEAELDNALPFDTIKPATYEKLDRVSPVLSSLRASSSDRVKTNKDFDWVRSDMERYKKQIEDKSVSMNEANRRKEKEENKARLDARKKELQARGEPQRKVWEFKIRDVDLAELPLLQKTNKVAVVHAPEGQKSSDPDGKADGEEDKTEEASIPDIDYVMDEAKQILLDFVRLSKTAERPGEATAAK